jgi:pilus assembly protein Flp/PilA
VCQGLIRNFAFLDGLRGERALKTLFGRFVSDQSGATSMKYGLIAAFLSAAIFIVLGGLGSNLFNTTFDLALNSQAER